jgi:hypothetical protein
VTSRGGSALWLLAAALAAGGCSARRDAAPAGRARRDPTAVRGGYAPMFSGARLRPRTDDNDLDPPRAVDSSEAPVAWDGVGAYGPTGSEGDAYADVPPWIESQGGEGWASGPGGAVPPGLRPPSDDPILVPASPYRGPADPPGVYERPGTRSGNDTFKAR